MITREQAPKPSYIGYTVRRERAKDWRVYAYSTLTGDLKDCVSMHTTRRAAETACKHLNGDAK